MEKKEALEWIHCRARYSTHNLTIVVVPNFQIWEAEAEAVFLVWYTSLVLLFSFITIKVYVEEAVSCF